MASKDRNEEQSPSPPLGDRLLSTLGSILGGKPPAGLLGVAWGEDISAAALKIGIQTNTWSPWAGGDGYEAAFDPDHPLPAFGAQARVRLIRREGKLAAISLRFRDCGQSHEALLKAVHEQLHVSSEDGQPYKVFGDGSVVRLEYDSGDNTCELTVTGPEFGKAYARYELGSGLGGLAAGLGPR